ncbi:MAG TPA: trimeric intracellular cation channel family protein [Hyphomicrobiaceae bacterium]|nr:trimeric intracellular cation channel family protein [Hyphomicrobiaceae bacterium]
MLAQILLAFDYLAVAVFAVTGALTASRKQMDVIGFLWLAIVTGVGGGTVRDLLLDQPVFWIRSPSYILVASAAALVVYFTAHIPNSRYKLILWLDAIGLAFVTVLGAEKALAVGAAPVIAVVMGTITASLGGIIRDILGHEPSILLKKEIYITAALAGAVAYVAALGLGAPVPVAAVVGAATAFLLRAGAIARGWTLPTYRARPGREF